MIRFFVECGGNTTRFDAPTDELFDNLNCIEIFEDIPIGGSEKVCVTFYPAEKSDKIAKIVCQRLLGTDKISSVNALCQRLDGLWRISPEELENAFAENGVRGAENMLSAYENLREELLGQSNELKM